MNCIDLKGEWSLKRKDAAGKRPAQVPGDNFSALLAAGEIEEPFFRDNENKLQWIGRHDWIYSREFNVDKSLLSCRSVYLNIEGVDTIATLSINGREAAKLENTFRRYRIEVKKLLKPGKNSIEVDIASPWRSAEELAKSLPISTPATLNNKYPQQNLLRKIHCHTGWGWAPCLAVSGIYGDVSLHGVDAFRIEHVYTQQEHVRGGVKLMAIAEILPAKTGRMKLAFSFDGQTVETPFDAIEGHRREVSCEFTVKQPKLWNPLGLGEQHLYKLEVSSADETRSCKVGLRKLELVTKKDSIGESFLFRVNGREVYCKGANWVPVDALPQRQTRERYEELLIASQKANMNMLRIWGGGQYEPDFFYEICDELGILVWQDFMFGNSMYPVDPGFLSNVAAEAEYQIKRLRHHACVALWCGDNEIIQKLNGDDGFTYPEVHSHRERYVANYARLTQVLTEQVAAFDPERRFWHSSPCSSSDYFEINHGDPTRGDVHYWDVMGQMQPIEAYLKIIPRFCSEFGFRSFPLPETAETYTDESDRYLFSKIMQQHNKIPSSTGKILYYLYQSFRLPEGYESFLRVSLALQAFAIETATAFWRSRAPRCMGALYWQLNDVYPVVSLSSLDYGCRWKPLHFHAKRFFSPVTSLCVVKDKAAEIWALNEGAAEESVSTKAEIFDFSGKRLASFSEARKVKPCRPALLKRIPFEELPAAPEECFIVVKAKSPSLAEEQSNCAFFAPYKDCPLPQAEITAKVTERDGKLKISLSANAPAFFVWVETKGVKGELSDNSIALLPGEARELDFTPADGKRIKPAALEKSLKAWHLRDSYK